MKALQEDPTPAHYEYKCKFDCLQVARRAMDRYELHGNVELLEAAISALNEARAMDDGRRRENVHMHLKRVGKRTKVYFGSD